MSRNNQLIVSLTGGLGNQLFQLACGLSLASSAKLEFESGIGKPRLNQEGLPEITSFKLPKNVHVTKARRTSWMPSKSIGYVLRMGVEPRWYEKTRFIQSVIKGIATTVMILHFKGFRKVVIGQGLGYSELDPQSKRIFLIGYFQSYRWSDTPDIGRAIESISIQDVDPMLQSYVNMAKQDRPLMVHVRLGDYKQESQFGVLGESYYSHAIEKISQYANFKNIWVFSDEIDLAHKIIPLKYHANVKWIPEISGSASKTLELMRYGTGYVIANSSFSWWGARLSYDKGAIVVYPIPWFVGIEDPIDLMPPTWFEAPRE
jgi:hypothetical protein